MTTADRMERMNGLLEVVEITGMEEVRLDSDDFKALIEQAQEEQVTILKNRKGIPTVIEYQGERFTYDSQSTFRGGVKRK